MGAFDDLTGKAGPKSAGAFDDVAPKTRADTWARGLGLSARAGLAGLGDLVGVLSDPIASTINLGFIAAGQKAPIPNAAQAFGWLADRIGFPSPSTDLEKFSDRVARAGYGQAVSAGVSGLAKPASEIGKIVATQFATRPGAQIVGAASAGGASELSAQAGLPWYMSLPISLAAGVAAPKAMDVAENLTNNLLLRASRQMPTQINNTVNNLIIESGFDPKQIGEGVRRDLTKMVGESRLRGVPLDPAAARNYIALRAAGVTPNNITRGMATRDPVAWRQEERLRDLDTVGEPLRKAYIGADEQIIDGIKRLVPGAVEDTVTGRRIVGGLQQVDDGLKAARDAAYAAAKSSPEIKEGVPVDALRRWLQSTRPDWAVKPEIKAIYGRLQMLAGDKPKITVEAYEQLRKHANSLGNRSDQRSLQAVSEVIDHIDDALFDAGKSEVFRDARQAHQLWKATTSDQKIIADLLKNTSNVDRAVAYEKVFQRSVLGGSVDQLKQLKNTLVVGGQEEAWQALRAKAAEYLTKQLQQREGGGNRPEMYQRAVESMREKLGVLFSPDEVRQIESAAKASQLVMQTPPRTYSTGSKTSSELANYLLRGLATAPGRAVNTMFLNLPNLGVGGIEQLAQRAQINRSLTGNPLLMPPEPPRGLLAVPAAYGALVGNE